VGRSLVAATSSSRFTQPTYWRDPASGTAYQVQVEIPQHRMRSIEDLLTLPVGGGGSRQDPQRATLVGDLARLSYGTMPGEVDRYNQQRMITILGNLAGSDLGSAVAQVEQAIARVGSPPRGVSVAIRGQAPALDQTLTGLGSGLLLSIVAILLLLAAYFQSARIPLLVLGVLPAVLAGVAVSLRLSGTTLNLQSFMGTIMAIGVSTANAILLVSFAEQARQEGLSSLEAALRSGISRLRPICMTTLAMIAGMVPMALAIGEGGEQTAPLGQAVIGGLAGSIVAVLLILPFLFAIGLRRARVGSPSLFHGDHSSSTPTSRGTQ
jgi:multidrug efflux pump subunit AcrB